MSTPKGDGEFNIYDDIREKLVAMGIPKQEIAFIHEANSDKQKDEKVKGEKVFFGGGGAAYATIAPIFQNALTNDLKRHANEIISVINAN